MNKFDEYLRPKLKYETESTSSPIKTAPPESDKIELIDALVRTRNRGMLGLLDDLEARCRSHLQEIDDAPDVEEIKDPFELLQQTVELGLDNHSAMVCYLLNCVLSYKKQFSLTMTLSQSDNEMAHDMYILGTIAKMVGFESIRHLAVTGNKRRKMLVDANKSESRKEERAWRHDIVMADAQQLVSRGCEPRNVASKLARRYKNEGFKPASAAHIRIILKKKSFY